MATNNSLNNQCLNDFTVTRSNSGGTNLLHVTNTSDTADSVSMVRATTAGTSAGDPVFQSVVTSGSTWTWGADNSASDSWKLSQGTALGTNDTVVITTAGEITNPLQPAFQAYLGTADSNVTGDGTAYYLGDTAIGNTLTEQYDQNSDFTPGASGGAFFTAPVTGIYQFYMTVMFDNLSAANTEIYPFFVHSVGSTVYYGTAVSGAARTGGNVMRLNNSMQISMTAADTVKFGVIVSGSTKTIGLNATSQVTWCYGSLLY